MPQPDPDHGPTVAYFAHDWGDAAIRRRVAGFRRDGMTVAGFAMHRAEGDRPDWVVADLGQTHDNRYLHRALAIARAARRAQGAALGHADVIVARNLDMLLVALAARRRARQATPVIYECLDIHRLVARDDAIGHVFRGIESRALGRCAGFWVSSPAFLERHFAPFHPTARGGRLVENRLQAAPGPRPCAAAPSLAGRLRIGWFGNLRCARSLALLAALAREHRGAVEIVLRGYPATAEIPDFDRIVASTPGLSYGGRYRWPDELAEIYDGVDAVWAGDFMDAGKNSEWLLPNRLYEGGWFGCPPIAPAASQTGGWIAGRACGLTLPEPLERSLPALVAALLADRAPLDAARSRLLALPEETFLEPRGTLASLVADALAGRQPGSPPAARCGISTAPSA